MSQSEQRGLLEEYGALVAVQSARGTSPTWRFSGLAVAAATTLSGCHLDNGPLYDGFYPAFAGAAVCVFLIMVAGGVAAARCCSGTSFATAQSQRAGAMHRAGIESARRHVDDGRTDDETASHQQCGAEDPARRRNAPSWN